MLLPRGALHQDRQLVKDNITSAKVAHNSLLKRKIFVQYVQATNTSGTYYSQISFFFELCVSFIIFLSISLL